MGFKELVDVLNNIAWGPWMLVFLVGTGVYYSFRLGFIQLTKFGLVMKNTIGKIFQKDNSGKGEVTPFQALTTALAATVGTGNIAGVTGAITVGGPGAVFWMWLSAFFGMVTKYAEVVLAVKYRERNELGDYVGGPMYYIKNGLGYKYIWLAHIFCILGGLAAFGIGNMTQVNTIATSINNVLVSFGYNPTNHSFVLFDQTIPFSSLIIGCVVAFMVALVLFGGIKRIGVVAEKLVPSMAVIYIVSVLVVIACNLNYVDDILIMIFKSAFNPTAVVGGSVGILIKTTIQKGVGRGVFSNEAGLGSAPMAHAATSEVDPIKQGFYGIFEVFMDTIVICTFTSIALLCGYLNGVEITWGVGAGAEMIAASFSLVMGPQLGSLIVAVCISLFALTTLLSWSLYGSRCVEFLFGESIVKPYQLLFVVAVVVGACLQLDLVWNIADTLNGFMAVPNLIALIALSPVVISLSKEYFTKA